MVKVVCFDLDGVFFEKSHQNLIANLAKRFSLNEKSLKEILFIQAAKEGGYNELKCGKISTEQYWDWLLKRLNLEGKATKFDFLEELQRGYYINREVAWLVKVLHQGNIKTAICSNNYQDNIEALDRKFNLDKYFDVMVFSYEVGVMKPDRRIYQALLAKAGSCPAELVYSDNDLKNIEAAKQMGINALLYLDFKGFKEQLKRLGVNL